MVGAYLSRFKGRGTDFEELREYVPGDDVRSMDWNVTARTGKPFIRLYREERELTMVIAVDISGSSSFGSGEATIRERAADVAACLAVSALKAGDKVGLLLFTDREELWVSPKTGRNSSTSRMRRSTWRPHLLRVADAPPGPCAQAPLDGLRGLRFPRRPRRRRRHGRRAGRTQRAP
jgi:hypothetical protein